MAGPQEGRWPTAGPQEASVPLWGCRLPTRPPLPPFRYLQGRCISHPSDFSGGNQDTSFRVPHQMEHEPGSPWGSLNAFFWFLTSGGGEPWRFEGKGVTWSNWPPYRIPLTVVWETESFGGALEGQSWVWGREHLASLLDDDLDT